MELNGVTINKYINDFLKKELDNYLHKHPDARNSTKENTGFRKKSEKLLQV